MLFVVYAVALGIAVMALPLMILKYEAEDAVRLEANRNRVVKANAWAAETRN